jgi:hypothetical protein
MAVACGPFFYQAPPSLDAYPERYGIRTWKEIFPDKYPQPPNALTQEQIENQCHELIMEFSPDKAFLKKLDDLAGANRVGDYRVRYANLLNEMRELAISSADPTATRAYLDWRFQHLATDDGFIHTKSFDANEDSTANSGDPAVTQGTISDIDQHLATCPAFLTPNWLVQRGAWLFRCGDFANAAVDFDTVLAKYPTHPRAEVAALMRARCSIENARLLDRAWESGQGGSSPGPSANDERLKASDLLAAYEHQYPHGRFLAEAIGWRGALDSDWKNYGSAVRDYLRQMDVQPTREVIRSALRECDRCFVAALDTEGGIEELPLDAIACHPAAAMSLIYLCTDPGARTDYEGYPYAEDYSGDRDPLAKIKIHVVQPRHGAVDTLLQLGKEIGKNKNAFVGNQWRAVYLAALGRIAIENGEPEEALQLAELGMGMSDPAGDLLLARGLALERLEKWLDAAASYEKLRSLDPSGPLAVDLDYRIARCQRFAARQGFAAAELAGAFSSAKTNANVGSEEGPPPYPELRFGHELEQWTDVLLQFAPLAELESAAHRSDLSSDFAQRLRSIIRCRALARGDYDRAAKWLETGQNPHPQEQDGYGYEESSVLEDWAWMDRNRWNDLVEPLRAAEQAAHTAADADSKARALLDLGARWERVRGKVTSPSLDPRSIFNSQPEIADEQRRKNAEQLALSCDEASKELDRRDEDAHALQAYLAAANIAISKETKARALAAANRCLLRMAQLTPFQADRAFERNDAHLSRELYQRLKQECAGTPEAESAVFYTFPSAAERGEWMPGDEVFWRAELDIGGALDPDLKTISNIEEGEWAAEEVTDAIHKKLIALADSAGTRTVAQLRSDIAALRAEFLPEYTSASQSQVINDLDDLALFLDQPGVTPAMCAKYFPMRVEGGDVTDTSELAPVGDFLAFLRTSRMPKSSEDEAGDSIRDWKGDAQAWRDFLRDHPQSPKAEAARLRLARAIYHGYRTHIGVEAFHWPDAPMWDGYKHMVVTRNQSFDRDTVFAPLDDYDRHYPKGRYAAEIRLMRGGASIDVGDYATAIANLTGILDDSSKRDLHLDASLELAECFSRLSDDTQRPRILVALRNQPRGIFYLDRFIRSQTLGSILLPMEAFFRETLGPTQWDAAIDASAKRAG